MKKLKLARLICQDHIVSGYWSDAMEPECPVPWPCSPDIELQQWIALAS